jgi:hypothetical protein
MKYNSWKSLFDFVYFYGICGKLKLMYTAGSYKISCDGISYFPISKRMAKKLIKEWFIEVETYE